MVQAPGGSGFERLWTTLALWRNRARGRAELLRLNAMLRRDLGLSDADIWREAQKFPWQP